ncbi:hypothetical protein [Atlantibacter hermannii]|uniref:hypothetical protein n=1 Tax=Atlantibacter hermannii TaxID=565 RepID=UPI0034D5436B
MAKPASVQNKIPVKESPQWLAFEYIMQKYGGVALVIIVCLGLLGLFSDGVLSSKRISDPSHALSVEYEKMGRIDSDMNIKIETATTGENVTLVLSGDLMEANEITTLYPAAERMTSHNGELVLHYRASPTPGPFAVWLGVTPRQVGEHHYTLRSGDKTLTFNQFILP